MLRIKKLTREELLNLPVFADACLCGDEVILRMGRSGFSLGYLPLEPAQWRTFPPRLPLPLEALSDVLEASVYGAFLEDRLRGLAVVRREESGWAEILDLRVDASCRRQRIATSLLASCEGFALRRQLPGLKVTISDQNPVMCQFLEASGFHVQGMDRFLFSRQPGETEKPLALRPCALILYKTSERG